MPAGLLAALLTLTMAIGARGGEVADSGWATTAAPRRSAPTASAFRAKAAYFSATAPSHDGWRRPWGAARPAARGSVRLVAYDDQPGAGGPGADRQGGARLRSIVVKQNGTSRTFHVAQQDDSADDELLRQFEQPFGADQTPDADTPDADVLPPLEPTQPSPSDEADTLRQGGQRDPFEEEQTDDFGGFEETEPEDLGSPGEEYDEMTDPDIVPARPDELALRRQNCAEALAELKSSTIAEIDLSIGAEGVEGSDYPVECSIDDGAPFVQRDWPEVTYMWKASALCHKPLYFEQAHLERYGHSWGPVVQPFVSGAHFFTRLPVLPYCMGLTAPNECIYTLGYYRPGSCAPYMIEPIGFTWRAAALEAAAWTGGAFAIP